MATAAVLKNRKIAISWPKFDHYAIQGHSRSKSPERQRMMASVPNAAEILPKISTS